MDAVKPPAGSGMPGGGIGAFRACARTRAGRAAAGGGGVGVGVRGIAGLGLDRAHFLEDGVDLAGFNDRFAGAEECAEFFGNGALDVGKDFVAVGVALEPRGGGFEIRAQGVVAGFLELVGVAAEVDGYDLVHGDAPIIFVPVF